MAVIEAWQMHHYKDRQLRGRLTQINKAIRGSAQCSPLGLSGRAAQDLIQEKTRIRAELQRRKAAK